jgi:hypothetical protein
VVQQNPLLEFGYEMIGGTPRWSMKPLSPGENAVRADNGEVWKYTGTGFKKTLATPSVWRSLWGLFPQSQLIDELWLRSSQTDRGWIGHPDPIRDVEGNVRFPKELMTLLASAFIPVQKIDMKAEREKDYRKRVGIAMDFRDEIRRATPERRQEMIRVLEAWTRNPNGIPLED